MLIIPHRLTIEFLVAHTDYNFVHSTNFWNNQIVGPALLCRGLANCYGVPVRFRLCKSSGYFQDSMMDVITKRIDEMIAVIPRNKPIVRFPKIGNGDSRMHVLAPKCYAYLQDALKRICEPVKYNYAT